MFNQAQARRPAGAMLPAHSQCEADAKEKLAGYIYEYLVLSGAQKSAEAFKEEVMSKYNPQSSKVGDPPGYLYNWWTLFYDLWCAAPERRDSMEPTQDSKMFYDTFIQGQYGPNPMMNGMMFPGGPMIPGPDGMMPPGFPGRFPPNRAGPIPGYGVFPGSADPRLAAQRMPAPQMRMAAGSFAHGPGVRPNPGGPHGMPPYRSGPFMDSPNQPFPPGSMLPNGMASQGPMAMSSPGMPPVSDSSHPSYMMGIPSSSAAMPFGMGDTPMGVPGNPQTTQPSMDGNQQSMMLMNGEEIKQSPSSTPRGLNGGTPAPGSVQSGLQSSGTPMGSNIAEEKPGSNSKPEDMDEISKIKEGLLNDFTTKEEATDQSTYGF